MLALAVMRLLEGCRQFFGLKPHVSLAYAGTVALAMGIVWWYWVMSSLGARVAVVSHDVVTLRGRDRVVAI